jgi:hypothetical protein
MTRFFVFSIAALAFAVSACERHPLKGQDPVTHTHGSNGAEAEGHGEKSEAKHEGAKHEEKKAEEAPAGAKEESPKFFPEKK